MKKNVLLKIIFIMLVIFILFTLYSFSNATFNPATYFPGEVSRDEADAVFNIGEKVWGMLRNLAVVVAVVTIAIIGLKYMFGSLEEKAEYKTTLIPWLIGATLVVMIATFMDLIQNLASKI